MNREILFRGKMIAKAVEGEWAYGNLNIKPGGRVAVITPDETVLGKYGRVDPDTVGQYTGLKDMNGVKIFEGDIIKAHYANALKSDFVEYVVFHNGRFSATPDNAHCWTMLADGVRHPRQDKTVYMESCEVIGNIYDNPELLKEAEPCT